MRRFRSGSVLAIISLWAIGCGGHRPAGQSPFVARVVLSPGGATSVQTGNFVGFTASAANSTGNNISTTFTYVSSDTSTFNIAPNGVGCAGHFDATFSTCTPGGTGLVTVTASAQGTSSPPTYIFVHPPIDNVTVTGILLNGLPIQQPCLTQGQTMTVEAHAFSQGSDITLSVGPVAWSANNPGVAQIIPRVSNLTYNFPTNQATVTAAVPGLTYIYASVDGVSSNVFSQPLPYHGATLNFFETCPVQNIVLQVGAPGSQQTGQTTFSVSKGISETVTATVTDVFGNQLSKVPLTWSATQPGSVSISNGCLQSCVVSTPTPGSGSVTASCSPPSCNAGFPLIPLGVSAPFIPLPVYASPLPPSLNPTTPGNGAVSGVVSGTTSPSTILATSFGCANVLPQTCTTGIYSFSTSKAVTGTATAMPDPPNSLLLSRAGDRAYVGSNFGAELLNPANLGTQNGAFTGLGSVTGTVLAVSPNGQVAIFSDALHTPNQVYVVNTGTPGGATTTALNVSESSVAAFSEDGLKAFIFGLDGNGNPNLYVYSTLQALQVIPLPALTSVNSIAFSTNGAFAYVVEPSLAGGNPAVEVFNTCDNQISTDGAAHQQIIPLSAIPLVFRALPDGMHFVVLENDGSLEYITATVTPIPTVTLTNPPTAATSLCPMTVSHAKLPPINLGQGNVQPITFFVSADGTLLYVVARDRSSILSYDFKTSSVGGIQLLGSTNPTPISADMTVDASTIVVAGSDGLVHQISTGAGGSDEFQFGFPNLANYLNPFCTFTPDSGACTFDVVAARP
jgi:hypothetical protein